MQGRALWILTVLIKMNNSSKRLSQKHGARLLQPNIAVLSIHGEDLSALVSYLLQSTLAIT